MEEKSAANDVQRILAMSPLEAAAWVNSALADRVSTATHFNWDALAAGCSTLAVDRDDASWAALGADLYEQLARESTSPNEAERRMMAAMQLHALMATRLSTGDRTYRAARLLAWFRDTTPLSISEATKRATKWQSLRTEEIRELRQLKSRLGILASVVTPDLVEHDRELADWLALRSQLP